MTTPATLLTPTVETEDRRDRNSTIAGVVLWRTVAFGILKWTIITGVPLVAILAAGRPLDRLAGITLMAFFGLALIFGILYVSGLFGDYRMKKQLEARYGCTVRFGLDTHQRRTIRVSRAPADLGDLVERILQKLSTRAQVSKSRDRLYEAKYPREGPNLVACRATVEIKPETENSVVVQIDSRLTEFAGFIDGGRNIVLVEEFQRAFEGRS